MSGDLNSSPPKVGDVLDQRYEITGTLGKGGMGSVYKARQLLLDQTVAIKMLSIGTLTAEGFQRFRNEAKLLRSLSHPNIVQVQSFGVHNGAPFIVMEYLEGRSLASILAEGPLPAAYAVQVFLEICEGLKCAHESGIIHRDLKPSNILVSTDVVKIIDFGIAKLIVEGENVNPQLTQTGQILGSPFYMSPEQCMGKEVDQRSDIYSLGCLMYEAIAGRPPFVGQNSLMTVSLQTSAAPPALPVNTPKKLGETIYVALSKNPDARFQNILELQDALRKTVQTLPQSGKTKLSEADTSRSKNSKYVFGLGLVLVVLATVGWVFANHGKTDSEQLQASILSGKSCLENSDWGNAEKKLSVANEQSKSIAGVSTKERIDILSGLADAQFRQGKLKDADRNYQSALSLFSKDTPPESMARVYVGFARISTKNLYNSTAHTFYIKALTCISQEKPINKQLQIQLVKELIEIDLNPKNEKLKDALNVLWQYLSPYYADLTLDSLYKKVLDRCNKRPVDRLNAWAEQLIGQRYSSRQDYKQAEEYFARALLIWDKLQDTDGSMVVRKCLSEAIEGQHEYARAQPILESLIAMQEKNDSKNIARWSMRTLFNLGSNLDLQKKYGEAEKAYRKELLLLQQNQSAEDGLAEETEAARWALIENLKHQDKFVEVQLPIIELENYYEKKADAVKELKILDTDASNQFSLGKLSSAERALEKAFAVRNAAKMPNDPHLNEFLFGIYRRLGETEKIRKLELVLSKSVPSPSQGQNKVQGQSQSK